MTQIDMVQRYRHLRHIAGEIQDAALQLVQHGTMLEFGRRLGTVHAGELWLDDQEIKLVDDLAIHTARPGRSRAIDRYARIARLPPDSDDARLLVALRKARFSAFQIEARHAVAGAMAYDLLLKQSFHLMDVSIGLSAEPKSAFVGRLVEADDFRMSCITVVPLRRALLEQALPRAPLWGKNSEIDAFQDPRCAIAVYRAAIELGYMRHTVAFDVVEKVPTARDVARVRDISDRRSGDWQGLTAAD